MADTKTSRKSRPLGPMTPFGKDLPEDRPSKVHLRNAAHYAAIRRHQESDARQVELEVGRDLHEKLKYNRTKKAKKAKREEALGRQVVKAAIVDEKRAKAAEEARQRDLLRQEYAKALAERKRTEKEKKIRKTQELAERRSTVFENRERRVRDRALAALARRTEVNMVF
ncbi:unnamed protein product [Ascophyllum nodosum]